MLMEEKEAVNCAGEKIKDVEVIEKEELKRGLKSRHMQMIAIGGAIGVGLFYGSAGAIQLAGPAVLLSYFVTGIAIFFICRAIGEMSVAEPVSGAVVSYSNRYLHPFVGFFLGWNGLLGMAAGSAAEFNALGKYVQYWLPSVPIWVSALCVVVFVTAINLVSVSLYGEVEFWLSIIKVITIIAMIVLGLVIIIFGFGNGGKAVGFGNLINNGGFAPNGFKGIFYSLCLAAFAFGGTDSVSLTAGEASDVKEDIPKAVNGVFWRIAIFYIGATLVMIALCPWNKIGLQGSPFVQVFSKVGIPAAAGIINFVVITAAISSMNSGIYGTSRTTYNLSLQGNAPKLFSKVTKNNVPFVAILMTVGFQLFGVLMNAVIPAKAFSYFSSIVVFSLIAGWVCTLLCQLKFRRTRIERNEVDKLSFKMPFWPYSSYFALAFMAVIMVVMALMPDTRVAYYVAPVWIFILYILYRIYNKAKVNKNNI